MQKHEDEEWTVTKLCVLLGRQISAMEMAGSEEGPVTHSNCDRPSENQRDQHMQSTAEGLLAGNSH